MGNGRAKCLAMDFAASRSFCGTIALTGLCSSLVFLCQLFYNDVFALRFLLAQVSRCKGETTVKRSEECSKQLQALLTFILESRLLQVDVRSAEYSYSFDDKLQQEWVWKEVYAREFELAGRPSVRRLLSFDTSPPIYFSLFPPPKFKILYALQLSNTSHAAYTAQPELFSYVEHVLERYDLKKSISFSTKVKSAKWNDSSKSWNITVGHTSEKVHSINDILPGKGTGESDDETVEADFLILATGCLSAPNLPKWPGFETYKGEIFHTARWPTEGHDFKGKKVAVIGTGSSAVQSIPVIAKEAAELTVFQRTATYR